MKVFVKKPDNYIPANPIEDDVLNSIDGKIIDVNPENLEYYTANVNGRFYNIDKSWFTPVEKSLTVEELKTIIRGKDKVIEDLFILIDEMLGRIV